MAAMEWGVAMRWFLILAAGAVMAAAGCATSPKSSHYSYGVFDAPVKTDVKSLPKDSYNPQAKPKLTCTRYAAFAVKEVDRGEKGAEKLAIIPADAPCAVDTPGEIRIDMEGYFKGVIGDYIFFDASDGWDGGVPFGVFAPDGRKLFDDSVEEGDFAMASRDGKTLRLQYTRVFHAPCSLYARRAECDGKVMALTGLGGEGAAPTTELPDCTKVYDAQLKNTSPEYRGSLKASPSVLVYPVNLTFDGTQLSIMPSGISASRCRLPT
jgi:hypothetical protein